ncbi:MAG: L-serine ammonia-lyase, iron-sulfur-dependent, subunit alpha, partial [Clostridium sp.]|nr:L-serine ammonia-lyase, iron-sulfur-dependent, subunit alpha [Clostridium sp.]
DRKKMSLRGILEYCDTVDLDTVRDTLENQIACNSAISQEGLDNAWGARVGKTILETWGNDVKARACARAAAGSDARMSGCPLPVVINSGSGNQGITVTMPVLVYAEEWGISRNKMFRALLVSNLVSIYIKHYIGPLSAFCGAVSAATGAGAAITYMSGGTYDAIARTITNTLGNVGGIVCDGAKPSCAAKIASSVHAALLAHYMSASDKEFKGGEGFIENDVEKTIKNMSYIGKIGMERTDIEILNVMIDRVDVESCL